MEELSLRDKIALEIINAYVISQGRHRRMNLLSRIKFWIGIKGGDFHYDYNMKDIAHKAYQAADLIISIRNSYN